MWKKSKKESFLEKIIFLSLDFSCHIQDWLIGLTSSSVWLQADYFCLLKYWNLAPPIFSKFSPPAPVPLGFPRGLCVDLLLLLPIFHSYNCRMVKLLEGSSAGRILPSLGLCCTTVWPDDDPALSARPVVQVWTRCPLYLFLPSIILGLEFFPALFSTILDITGYWALCNNHL